MAQRIVVDGPTLFLKLGDTVFYHRRHQGDWLASPAQVVVIGEGDTPALGLWVCSHPIPHEAYPLFWRPNVPFLGLTEGDPYPEDGAHFWTFR